MLMQHFQAKRVTATTYAWPMLRTVFTEVLDEQQWYQLWDNVISSPSYFLLFAAVAYNITQRAVLLGLASLRTIEKFFDEENSINMKSFVRKVYWLMDNCPSQLHPKKYMRDFDPLQTGHYQKILNYPKIVSNVRDEHIEELKCENQILNKKLYELEKLEMALVDRLTNGWRKEEHERRMKKVEQTYQEALVREEQRVAYQRKQLLLYQRQLKDRESQILDAAWQGRHEQVISQREDELSTFLNDMERHVSRFDEEANHFSVIFLNFLFAENSRRNRSSESGRAFSGSRNGRNHPTGDDGREQSD